MEQVRQRRVEGWGWERWGDGAGSEVESEFEGALGKDVSV